MTCLTLSCSPTVGSCIALTPGATAGSCIVLTANCCCLEPYIGQHLSFTISPAVNCNTDGSFGPFGSGTMNYSTSNNCSWIISGNDGFTNPPVFIHWSLSCDSSGNPQLCFRSTPPGDPFCPLGGQYCFTLTSFTLSPLQIIFTGDHGGCCAPSSGSSTVTITITT